jgi:uncharacterized protein YggE
MWHKEIGARRRAATHHMMTQTTHRPRRPARVVAALLALLLLAPVAFAQPQPPRDPEPPPPPPPRREPMRDPPSIVVTGRGESAAAPDRAVVRLGAVGEAKDAKAAQEQVNQVTRKVIDAVKNVGIDERDVQTSDLSLEPVYSHPPPIPFDQQGRQQQPQEPRITGYRAHNTLEIRVNEIAKVGDVVDAGIGAGANQLQGVSFQLHDDAKPRAEALRQAVEKARADAETLAAALGVQLGPIDEAMTGHADVFPPQPRMARMMAGAAMEMATPVQPGEVRVHATVSLRYRITGGGNPRRAEAGQQDRTRGDRNRDNPPAAP